MITNFCHSTKKKGRRRPPKTGGDFEKTNRASGRINNNIDALRKKKGEPGIIAWKFWAEGHRCTGVYYRGGGVGEFSSGNKHGLLGTGLLLVGMLTEVATSVYNAYLNENTLGGRGKSDSRVERFFLFYRKRNNVAYINWGYKPVRTRGSLLRREKKEQGSLIKRLRCILGFRQPGCTCSYLNGAQMPYFRGYYKRGGLKT